MKTKDIKFAVDNILMLDNPHTEGMWVNPDIKEVTSHLDSCDLNVGFLDGPFVRIWFDWGNKCRYHAVVMLNQETYNTYLESCFDEKCNKSRKISDDIISETIILLTEDIWMPGGEQFCFTEHGRLISKDILAMGKNVKCMTSPDIGVQTANKVKDWSWSS